LHEIKSQEINVFCSAYSKVEFNELKKFKNYQNFLDITNEICSLSQLKDNSIPFSYAKIKDYYSDKSYQHHMTLQLLAYLYNKKDLKAFDILYVQNLKGVSLQYEFYENIRFKELPDYLNVDDSDIVNLKNLYAQSTDVLYKLVCELRAELR